MLKIHLNGKEQTIEQSVNLRQLLGSLNIHPASVVVEHNEKVILRKDLESVAVGEGDKVEIIHFIGGGAPAGDTIAFCFGGRIYR